MLQCVVSIAREEVEKFESLVGVILSQLFWREKCDSEGRVDVLTLPALL